MNMVNCIKCGKVFQKMSTPLCPECEKLDEKIFEKIKDYLSEHPESSLAEVAKATEVSTKKIMRYLKEGRLEASDRKSVV